MRNKLILLLAFISCQETTIDIPKEEAVIPIDSNLVGTWRLYNYSSGGLPSERMNSNIENGYIIQFNSDNSFSLFCSENGEDLDTGVSFANFLCSSSDVNQEGKVKVEEIYGDPAIKLFYNQSEDSTNPFDSLTLYYFFHDSNSIMLRNIYHIEGPSDVLERVE